MTTPKIKFFRHTADVEFEVYGRDLLRLFESAAFALFDVMVNTKKVKPTTTRTIAAKGRDLEALMYDFLEQFVILHDAENLVFSEFRVAEVAKTPEGHYVAKAEAGGEEFDERRHEGRTGIKAVTYHDMKIGQKKDGCWFAHIVLDI